MLLYAFLLSTIALGTLGNEYPQIGNETSNSMHRRKVKSATFLDPQHYLEWIPLTKKAANIEKETPSTKKWRFQLITPAFETKHVAIQDPIRNKKSNLHSFSGFESERIRKNVRTSDIEAVKTNLAKSAWNDANYKRAATRIDNSSVQPADIMEGQRKIMIKIKNGGGISIFRSEKANRRRRKNIPREKMEVRPEKNNRLQSISVTSRSIDFKPPSESPLKNSSSSTRNSNAEKLQFGSRIADSRSLKPGYDQFDSNRTVTTRDFNLKKQSEKTNHSHKNNEILVTVLEPKLNDSSEHFRSDAPRRKNCRLSSDGHRWRCLKRKRKKLSKDVKGSKGQIRSSFDPPDRAENRRGSNDVSNHLRVKNYNATHITPEVQTRNFDKRKLDPCSCTWSPEKCGCYCDGPLKYDDFMNLCTIIRPCEDFTFSLTNGHYYALPPNLFSNLRSLRSFNLSITNATFEHLLDPTPAASAFTGVSFSGSASVQLRNVAVRRSWNWGPFEQLRSVRDARASVIVEGCDLRRLASDFSRISDGNVADVSIAGSNVAMIGSSAFGTFEDMRTLRLPDNRLTAVRREDLPERPLKLELIDLRNNQLQNLEENMFGNMPSLKEVALSGNPFKVLSEKTFNVIVRIHFPGISDFPLNCDCNLQWLKDSALLGNEMTQRNMKGVMCKKPRYLRGIPFENLSKEHLTCS